MKCLTIVLLVIQLCLPAYGGGYFLELLSSVGTGHTGFVCAHDVADSQDDQEQTTFCHEIDAPCDLPSGLALDHSYAVSPLASMDRGSVLPGYGDPIDIPPESLRTV